MKAKKSPTGDDKKKAMQNTEYEIEKVIGERGVIAQGTKQYKVKWKDHSEASWEDHATFNKKNSALQAYKAAKKAQSHSVAAIANIAADILSCPSETLIQEICKSAGVSESQVLFVYAGIPCDYDARHTQ